MRYIPLSILYQLHKVDLNRQSTESVRRIPLLYL
jgi:hypothetical protein